MKMVKKNWLLVVLIGVLVLIVGMGLLVKFGMERAAAEEVLTKFPDRGVPRINITLNGVTLEEINAGSKDAKYEGNEVAVYEGEEKTLEAENVRVKGRGNTTWQQDKKPYQITFKNRINLFGLGEEKKWVLLANRLDITQLRNDIAMRLAEMVGVEYNHRGKYIELYIDGSYNGVYYVVQKIEIDKGSVDLRRSDGVLFELDMVHRSEPAFYSTYFDECLVLKDSVINNLQEVKGVARAFVADLDEAERAIEGKDYKRVDERLDIDSFARYFLVNEFAVNPDAYSTSFYLYRNNEGKISAGPVWDFDLAFSNKEWVWQVDEKLFSPYEEMVKKREAFGFDGLKEDRNISRLFYYLMEMPEYRDKVESLFQKTMSGKVKELVNEMQKVKNDIAASVLVNNKKWQSEKDYEEECERLFEWIKARYEFLERNYGKG